ncbi:MAG TPA: DUF1592 domain-containing protein [Steroidobacteraceae bacterium]
MFRRIGFLAVLLPMASACLADSHFSMEEFTKQYCSNCHNTEDWAGGLAFDTLPESDMHANRDVWEKVIRKLRVGMMPPLTAETHLPPQQRQAALTWLVKGLDDIVLRGPPTPDEAPQLIHRLNRSEYQNAIRDLLDLEVDATTLLPPDDAAFGFDNNAQALGVSPVLIEQYLSAAGKISALAVGDPDTGPVAQTFRVPQDASQNIQVEGMPVGTVGGRNVHVVAPLDGQYHLDVTYYKSNLGAMKGLELPSQFEIAVDGKRVHLAKLGGEADFKALMHNITEAADAINARSSTVVALPAGPHDISFGFVYEGATENSERLQPFQRSSQDLLDVTGHPHVESLTVTGPYNPTGPGDSPSRRQIFSCQPKARTAKPSAEELACARAIVARLARQAYRGTGTDKDADVLMDFFARGRARNGFESGIQAAVERVLASPKFVFRTERDPANVRVGTIHKISDLELASRLSFFLWSSIPDETLLQLADKGRLSDPAILDKQVDRMLADPKARALTDNFAAQWLYLRNLNSMVPNSSGFPNFDDNLRQAMRTETELFFESIVREDRNVLDLMTANYTYLNERLARHYGINDVYGNHFRRVILKDEARWGLLGKGSTLMVTSHTDRTSTVVRGKWILENILGASVPAPPPDIPPLPDSASDSATQTMRQRMEVHRANPVCASCHNILDPIGYSMENFNAVGAWRERENGLKSPLIDASGKLLGGVEINGPIQLRDGLLKQPETFVSTVTEKLMIYALGRGLVPADMPTIRQIVRDSGKKDYRFSTLIRGIVHSVPFQMRADSSTSHVDTKVANAGPIDEMRSQR